MVNMMRCQRCLLPADAPQADIDGRGVCAFCRGEVASEYELPEARRREFEADLEASLSACRGQGPYDAVVCLSGGKDSCYLLYKLHVEYGLRVLAYTTNVNIPELAWRNIRRTVRRLGVDHLVYSPPERFYHKLFRHLLTHQEPRGAVYTVSYVYAPLFEGDALRVAVEKGIPLILAGYSPGQPEPDRMVYEFSRELIERTNWCPPALRESDVFSDDERARFWDPRRHAPSTPLPRYLAPFHAWAYDQEHTIRRCVELGLVARASHASPVWSNYPINWLLMYSDLRNLGYNPYAPEFAALIRTGRASRRYWRVAAPAVDLMIRRRLFMGRNVTRYLRWLELQTDELRITEPHGAYDPPPGELRASRVPSSA